MHVCLLEYRMTFLDESGNFKVVPLCTVAEKGHILFDLAHF